MTVPVDPLGTVDVECTLRTPDTDETYLGEVDMDIQNPGFDTLLADNDDLPPLLMPVTSLSDPPTPCLNERPSPVLPYSQILIWMLPHFLIWWQTLPLSRAVPMSLKWSKRSLRPQTQFPGPQTELQAAVHSILPKCDTMTEAPVDSIPWTSDGPTPCRVSTTADVPDGDILAQAMSEAHIGVDETPEKTPEIEAIPLSRPVRQTPAIFFMALRAWRITLPIQEARERAIRGWRDHGYSVWFTPMNLFAIRKVESIRLPEGLEYTLSSFWIERDEALL